MLKTLRKLFSRNQINLGRFYLGYKGKNVKW